LGLGSTTPDSGRKLHIEGGDTTVGITLKDTAGTQYGIKNDANSFIIRNDSLGLDRLVIDTAGNVGIGVTPTAKLHVSGTIQSQTGSSVAQMYSDGGAAFFASVGAYPSVFLTNGAERMRIDASGNLLVGKTAQNLATEGISINPLGYIQVTEDQSPTLYLNRLTTDGSIVNFYKDGSTVGSIGTASSYLTIGSPVGSGGHLLIGNNLVHPATSTGGAKDNAIDIGGSSNRFKDLYLSGGAYLGGTGSANKLDDYETGNFDPHVTTANSDMSGITYISQIGSYVKVGDLVWFRLQVGFSATTIGTGNFRITDLPFVSKNDAEARQAAQVLTYNLTWDSTWQQIASEGVQNSSSIDFLISRSGNTWVNLKATDMSNSTTYYYIVSGCYQTA
jgi:hypothetical protein